MKIGQCLRFEVLPFNQECFRSHRPADSGPVPDLEPGENLTNVSNDIGYALTFNFSNNN